MALNERLGKFKQQQERCQTTLSSIAASQASILRPKVAPGFRPANAPFTPLKSLQPVKFSDDTERLQQINSVRKSTVGAQIKLVIELLEKKRQAFTAEQINEATYVDIRGNKAVFESLKNNPKVNFVGERFCYKPTHALTGRNQLLKFLIETREKCIAVEEVKDAYPSVLEDLQALKASGDVWWLSGTNAQEDTVHFNDRGYAIRIDNDLKQLYREIELPRDMLDIEKELKKCGEKPLTDTVKRRASAQKEGAASKSKPKPRKKKRGLTRNSRLTNHHLPELFKDLET